MESGKKVFLWLLRIVEDVEWDGDERDDLVNLFYCAALLLLFARSGGFDRVSIPEKKPETGSNIYKINECTEATALSLHGDVYHILRPPRRASSSSIIVASCRAGGVTDMSVKC
jgi:hypothetical protein